MKREATNDRYRRARGGSSRFLSLFCAGCGAYLLRYQKDGPGDLRRLYHDRIGERPGAAEQGAGLRCAACTALIGVKMIYVPAC